MNFDLGLGKNLKIIPEMALKISLSFVLPIYTRLFFDIGVYKIKI